MVERTRFTLGEEQIPQGLVQHLGRPAGPAVAAAPSGHPSAPGPGRSGPPLPDGADHAGGLDRAGDRDPRAGPRPVQAVSPQPSRPCPSAREGPRYARPHLLQERRRQRGRQPQAQHRDPQAFYNKEEGIKRIATETGAGQWGSALAYAGAMFGVEVKVYMVRASYDQKPYRRLMMETYGASVVASPSNETAGRPGDPGRAPEQPRLTRYRHQRGRRGRGASATTLTTRSARSSTTSCSTRP